MGRSVVSPTPDEPMIARLTGTVLDLGGDSLVVTTSSEGQAFSLTGVAWGAPLSAQRRTSR